MCDKGAGSVTTSYDIIMDVIGQNEPQQERRIALQKEIEAFLGPGGNAQNFPNQNLDPKCRDAFLPIFTRLKKFLYDEKE